MTYTILTKEQFNEVKHDKSKTFSIIKSAIRERNLPLPLEHHNYDEANRSFEYLRSMSCLKLLTHGAWSSRHQYKYPPSNWYIDLNNDGLKASNHFTFDNRMKCDYTNSPSPSRIWNSDTFMDSMLESIYSLKHDEITAATLKTSLALRQYIPSQFRPSAAKCLYQLFNAEHVLDFSAGWGDRLVAALATNGVVSYTGVDPNTEVFNKYQEIRKFNHATRCLFINQCAEDTQYDDKFDFVFTSPPYYNTEQYTQDENQSFKKYPKLTDWLEKFLFQSIRNAWAALTDEGFFAINISDVNSNQLCDPMNRFMKDEILAHYVGCIGYRLQKRASRSAGILGEPIWVWSKKKTTLERIIKTKLARFPSVSNLL